MDADIRLIVARDDASDSAVVCTYTTRSKDGVFIDVYSPYGFGGIYAFGAKEGCASLIDEVRTHLIEECAVTSFLMGHPLMGPDHDLFEGHRTAYLMHIGNLDDAWSGMRPNYRNEIMKLEKDGDHEVIFDKSRLVPALMDLYFETLERVGASNTYYFSKTTLGLLMQSDTCTLVGVDVKGKIPAVIMLLNNHYCAEYFINASDTDGRLYTKQLIWEGVKKLHDRGCSTFNLGGGAQEGDFLESFKRRFGGEKRVIPLWKDILMSGRYQELCETYDAAPSSADYFPAYWKK